MRRVLNKPRKKVIFYKLLSLDFLMVANFTIFMKNFPGSDSERMLLIYFYVTRILNCHYTVSARIDNFKLHISLAQQRCKAN